MPKIDPAHRALPRVKSIESLRRGLEVLRTIADNEGIDLAQLHDATSIPKASLLRIAKTLEESGCIRRDSSSGQYRTVMVVSTDHDERPAPTAPVTVSRLVSAAQQCIADLTDKIPWASDVGVLSGTSIQIVLTNRPKSALGSLYNTVGQKVDMVHSAMGRAYLAFCHESEKRDLLQKLLPLGSTLFKQRERLTSMLESAKINGYAIRDGNYAGPDTNHGRHLSAIALPIFCEGRVVACINCVWRVDTAELSHVIQRALAHVARQAEKIGMALER